MAGNLTYAQLEGVWLNAAQGTQYATKQWAALMAAIAEAESGGNPNATNPNDNGGKQTSWGLWQISLGNHTAPSPNWNDPGVNASLALGKLQSQGLSAWGTYTSGAYRGYLSGSTTPDTSGIGAVDTSAATGAAASTAAQAESNCAWRINFNIPVIGGDLCIVSYSQIRAILAGGILVGGAVLAVFGLSSLLASSSGGQRVVGAAARVLPAGRAAAAAGAAV